MEIRLAKSAGFCFGVQRAVDMVYKAIEENKSPLYTYGPIIHNDTVVQEMKEKGVIVMDENNLDNYEKGIVILRSHGVSKNVADMLESKGHILIDATCPFVKKIHNIVNEKSSDKDHIIVIGDKNHPEVKGIIGWITTDAYSVVKTREECEALNLPTDSNVTVVAQTTFNSVIFTELVEVITKKGYNTSVLSTICNATHERQEEARKIAAESEAMIVIGDTNSSNSRKLYEICLEQCNNTYFIQTAEDLDYSALHSINLVGITAGASTPNNIIKEVQNNVRNEF